MQAHNFLRAMQVRLNGLWPTIRRCFLTGWQGGTGNALHRGAAQQGPARQAAPERRQTRQQRFQDVARVVQSLPMEEFVTRDDLQRCSLHELREKLRQRGVKEVGLERNEAVERVLAADGGTTSRCCTFSPQSGDELSACMPKLCSSNLTPRYDM